MVTGTAYFALMAAVLCFSLAACGNNSELEKYEKYETLIDYLEAEDYESALAEMVKISGNADILENDEQENDEQEDGEQEDTQQSEAEPVEQMIEVTLDNWQDYFEIQTQMDLYRNDFGEIDNPRLSYRLKLKEEFANDSTTYCKVAFEYRRDMANVSTGYYEYDTQTDSLTIVKDENKEAKEPDYLVSTGTVTLNDSGFNSYWIETGWVPHDENIEWNDDHTVFRVNNCRFNGEVIEATRVEGIMKVAE